MHDAATVLEKLTSGRRWKAYKQRKVYITWEVHPKHRGEKWMGVDRVINSEETGGWGRDPFWERGSWDGWTGPEPAMWQKELAAGMEVGSVLTEHQASLGKRSILYLGGQQSGQINWAGIFKLGLFCTWIEKHHHLNVLFSKQSIDKTKEKYLLKIGPEVQKPWIESCFVTTALTEEVFLQEWMHEMLS